MITFITVSFCSTILVSVSIFKITSRDHARFRIRSRCYVPHVVAILNEEPELMRLVMIREANWVIKRPIIAPVSMDIDHVTALALVSAPKNWPAA